MICWLHISLSSGMARLRSASLTRWLSGFLQGHWLQGYRWLLMMDGQDIQAGCNQDPFLNCRIQPHSIHRNLNLRIIRINTNSSNVNRISFYFLQYETLEGKIENQNAGTHTIMEGAPRYTTIL